MTNEMTTRRYKTRIPGDTRWVASVECASGILARVEFWAPEGEQRIAAAVVAPGTRVLRLEGRPPGS